MDEETRQAAADARWQLREAATRELKTAQFWARVQYPALCVGLLGLLLQELEITPDMGVPGVALGVFVAAWVICQEARSKANTALLQSWDLVVALSAMEEK